jgi:hypothetical protein
LGGLPDGRFRRLLRCGFVSTYAARATHFARPVKRTISFAPVDPGRLS